MKFNKGFTCFLIIGAISICLVGSGIAWVITSLLPEAEQSFGLASDDLSLYEHIYLSYRLMAQKDLLKHPADSAGASLSFQVKAGEPVASIASRLEQQGLIDSADALRDFLVYAGMDRTLQAGEYKLNSRMTPIEIALSLQDATPNEVVFNILPGWRLEEIAASLPTSGLSFASADFLDLVRGPSIGLLITEDIPPGTSLEGFLFPDSYRLPRQISLEDFLLTVLSNFRLKVDGNIKDGFKNQGLNLLQSVTLASMIEREAVLEEEMPLIASVFLNRLANGMKLDSDPTVQYAHGYVPEQNSWWKNPLNLNDLEVNSPYNTYLYTGLPPAPISNPSLNALLAVAFPAKTSYFYFRMACDGSGRHSFAETFEEHLANGCP